MKTITFILAVVATATMVFGCVVLIWWTSLQLVSLTSELIPEPTIQKTSAQKDAEKRDECLKNGFDYEFVNEFWYIGVRCKK